MHPKIRVLSFSVRWPEMSGRKRPWRRGMGFAQRQTSHVAKTNFYLGSFSVFWLPFEFGAAKADFELTRTIQNRI